MYLIIIKWNYMIMIKIIIIIVRFSHLSNKRCDINMNHLYWLIISAQIGRRAGDRNFVLFYNILWGPLLIIFYSIRDLQSLKERLYFENPFFIFFSNSNTTNNIFLISTVQRICFWKIITIDRTKWPFTHIILSYYKEHIIEYRSILN